MVRQIACDSCRLSKSKCSGEKPRCERCAEMSMTCVYSPRHQAQQPKVYGKNRAITTTRTSMQSRITTIQKSGSSRGTIPYTKEEVGFLINWLDHCIMTNDDFRATIAQVFKRRFGREVSLAGSERKAVDALRALGSLAFPTHIQPEKLRTEGSKCLNWSNIPVHLVDFYNRGRQELGLPLLLADATSDAESHREPSDQARACTSDIEEELSDDEDEPRPMATGAWNRAATTFRKNQARAGTLEPLSTLDNKQMSKQRRTASKGDISSTIRKNEKLSEMVTWLLNRFKSAKEITVVEVARLESMRTEVQSDRDPVFASLLRELIGQEKKNVEYQDMISKLVGPHNILRGSRVSVALAHPTDKDVELEWKAIWETIRLTTASIRALSTPSSPEIANFADHVDDAFRSSKAELTFTAWFRHQAKKNEGLCSMIQAYLGRLLCRRVFFNPKLVLKGQHSFLLMHLYRLIGQLDGLDVSKVRNLDGLATKLFVEDELTQEETIPNKASEEAEVLTRKLHPLASLSFNVPTPGDLTSLCVRAIKLQMQLLASPLEYRIRYFRQGTPFDREWMDGEDTHGVRLPVSACLTKRVLLCFFPAIACHLAPPLDGEAAFAEAFTVNKDFEWRPDCSNRVGSSMVLTRAVVLVA